MPKTSRQTAIRLAAILLTTAAAALHLPPCYNRREVLLGLGTAATLAPLPAEARASRRRPTTTSIPTWNLGDNVEFPTLALNTAGLTTESAKLAFQNALEVGISHVEFHPGVERDGVARVLRSIPKSDRRSVFLTTKVETNWENSPSPEVAATYVRKQLDDDLAILGVDYVDMLMLRESPNSATIQAMWAEMEREQKEGRTRSLGVVNYCKGSLKCLLSTAQIKPSVNYIQQHVGMGPKPQTRAFSESLGIRTFAYGHIGERASPPNDTQLLLNNPTLRNIAKAHSKTVDETALRWVLQTGAAASVRPTSEFRFAKLGGVCVNPKCAEGLRASAQVFGWELTSKEMNEINALSAPDGNPTLFSSPGCPGSFFS